MANEGNQAVEDFIRDWYWDQQSHQFAQDLGNYLFQFIDSLFKKKLSDKTIRKHMNNCWCIGILECGYGYRDRFSPHDVFFSPEASYKYAFKRKMSDSRYAVNAYRSTWRQLHNYTNSFAGISDKH